MLNAENGHGPKPFFPDIWMLVVVFILHDLLDDRSRIFVVDLQSILS
jgi:hypothetical protein